MPDQATWQVTKRWSSSPLGEKFTGAEPWKLFIDPWQLHFFIQGKDVYTGIGSIETMSVAKGWFWSTITLATDNDGTLVLKSIPRMKAAMAA